MEYLNNCLENFRKSEIFHCKAPNLEFSVFQKKIGRYLLDCTEENNP